MNTDARMQMEAIGERPPQRQGFFRKIFEMGGLLLTIVALSLAIKQYYDSAQVIGELKHQSELASTQPVGVFPVD